MLKIKTHRIQLSAKSAVRIVAAAAAALLCSTAAVAVWANQTEGVDRDAKAAVEGFVRGDSAKTLQSEAVKPRSRVPTLKVVPRVPDEIRSPSRSARNLADGVLVGRVSDETAAALFRKAFSLARFTLEGLEMMGTTRQDVMKRFSGCTEVTSFGASKVLSCERPKGFAGSGEYVLLSFMPVSDLLVGIQTYFEDARSSQSAYDRWIKTLAERYDAYEEQFVEAVDSVFWRISLGREAQGQGRWLRISVNDEEALAATERFLQLDVAERTLGALVFGETSTTTIPPLGRDCEAAVYNSAYDKDYLGKCFGFPYDAHYQLMFSQRSGTLRQLVISPLGQVTVEILDEILRSRHPDAAVCQRLETSTTVNSARSIEILNPARRYRNINGRAGTVYVGTCREPRVYESEGRFIFDLTMLDAREMLANYEARKSVNANFAMRIGEREMRRQRLGEFFNNPSEEKDSEDRR